jgi:Ice-binding-like/Bacterial Ig-like domain
MSNCKRSSAMICGWFMALLLSALLAGCGGHDDDNTSPGATAVLPGAAGTPGASATNPTVGSASPGNSATNVPTQTNGSGNVVAGPLLTATFSGAMNPLTITTIGTFTLKETITGTNVPGSVTMNAANTIATFTPTGALAANKGYTATVSTAAMNAAGTAMPSPIAWSFTTSAAASSAQAPVNLLSMSTNNFVILTKTGITNTGSHGSAITGNIGASPITASAMTNVFCAEITGTIYGVDAAYVGSGAVTCSAGNPPLANKTLVDNAVADMGTAYTEAAGRTSIDVVNELGAGLIGGMTLAPGLYKWSTDVLISTNVTLSGGANDVWIFQVAGNLDIAAGGSVPAGIKVILAGGAKPSNIFWQVGGVTGATLGTFSTFNGTILSAKQVILRTGAVLNGRALAQTQVVLDANPVTLPTP